MSDARETIARAILDRMRDPKGYTAEDLADAVIEALGLVGDALPGWCEHRWNDFVGDGECDCKPLRRRYVTPWEDV